MSRVTKNKIVDIQTALDAIPDGATVATGGFVSTAIPEYIYIELAKRYAQQQHPRDLTLVYAAGQGDGKSRGLNHLAADGLVSKIIGGHYGLVPKLGAQVIAGKIQGYNLPQGIITHLFRNIASKKPLIISKVIEAILAMIEPATIVILGAVLGSIIVAIYLPLFHLGDVVG